MWRVCEYVGVYVCMSACPCVCVCVCVYIYLFGGGHQVESMNRVESWHTAWDLLQFFKRLYGKVTEGAASKAGHPECHELTS